VFCEIGQVFDGVENRFDGQAEWVLKPVGVRSKTMSDVQKEYLTGTVMMSVCVFEILEARVVVDGRPRGKKASPKGMTIMI